jgi:hypothetical protein
MRAASLELRGCRAQVSAQNTGANLGHRAKNNKIIDMIDKIIWGAPFVLGLLFVWSAASPSKPGTKWYLRLLIGVLGIYLLSLSVTRLFLLAANQHPG